jgi:hypothetical protein
MKNIIEAICAITGAVKPVEKRGRNDFQKYDYATAADVLHQLQPLLSQNGLVVFHTEADREEIEGGVLAITYEFSLVHKSGEQWQSPFRQTGMAQCRNIKGGFDDKAANKCLTAAMKYFLVTLFKIPTGDFPEADADDANAGQTAKQPPARPTQARKGANGDDLEARMIAAIKGARSIPALDGIKDDVGFKADFAKLSEEGKANVSKAGSDRRIQLETAAQETGDHASAA